MSVKTFKEWVESHNPQEKWNWENPDELAEQLVTIIGECGHIDLEELYVALSSMEDPGFYDLFEKKC